MSTKRNLNLSLACPCCSTINVPTLQNVGINLQGHNRKWWRNDRFKTLLKQPLVLEYFPCWNLSCMFTWIRLSVMAPDADGEQELLYVSFFPNPHTRERRHSSASDKTSGKRGRSHALPSPRFPDPLLCSFWVLLGFFSLYVLLLTKLCHTYRCTLTHYRYNLLQILQLKD